MVSTDSEKIASVAREVGAEVPFLRSARNSDDQATTAAALVEVLEQYSQMGNRYDIACCCYPASPFITSGKLRSAYQLMTAENADAVIPIVEYSTPVLRAFEMKDNRVSFLWPEYAQARSQDLPSAYFDAGQFYFFKTGVLLKEGHFLTQDAVGFPVPSSQAQDIDTEEDWKLAELKYSLWQEALSPEYEKR
jgi:N-acylneuraminate cytidylyltransferase